MAEARSAVAEPRVIDADEEVNDTWTEVLIAWRRQLVKGFFKTRNRIRNGLWPTHVYNLGVGVALFSTSLVGDWKIVAPINRQLWAVSKLLHVPEGLPYYVRVLAVSVTGGVVFFVSVMYARRWLLRVLLSYRGWMYENPHRQSFVTKAWSVVVWMVSGYHPTTFSYQKSLPRLPVPSVSATVDKFVSSMEPLYGVDSKEFQSLIADAQEFKKDMAPKLNRLLVLKSYWAPNWVTDWWEKYVYLMSRIPLPINSNYYVLDFSKWYPTTRQTSRAANSIYHFLAFKRLIEHETLPPMVIRNTIPLCMAQYERLFSTTRIPGVEFDELIKYDSTVSKHVSVLRKGIYYRLDVFDSRGRILTTQSLERQLNWIMADADLHIGDTTDASRSLGALTTLGRSDWAKTRNEFFAYGANKDSLDIIESSIFHVVLDTESYSTWDEEGKRLIHGDGTNIWFDKSFTAVFFANGRLGLNAEHSWGDAPIVGHMSEYNLTNEVLNSMYDDEGFVIPMTHIKQASLITPQRLIWNIPSQLENTIEQAATCARQKNDDLDIAIIEHEAYGKGFIKTCKVSPDAYVQLALQMAYFKDSGGKIAMTYESSMTRLYLQGRTETVRSLTKEGADFIRYKIERIGIVHEIIQTGGQRRSLQTYGILSAAGRQLGDFVQGALVWNQYESGERAKSRSMVDKTQSKAQRIALLRRACDVHQLLYRNAMSGSGIDRHIFGLFVVSKGLGYESNFLKNALMVPWTLSTSQQPQQQMANSPDCNDIKFRDKLCPGGGFGPVADHGYGVSYMLPGDAKLFFHISSKRSTADTDSTRFARLLFESLDDMRQLFDDSGNK